MNNRQATYNALPASGPCAFVRGAAMSLVEVDCRDPHAQHWLASKRPQGDRQEEDQMHPGEGGA